MSAKFLQLGRLLCEWRWGVLIAWLAAALLLNMFAPAWESVAIDGDLEYLPADTPVLRGVELSARAFPNDRAKSQIALVFSRPGQELSADDRQAALELGQQLEQLPELPTVDVWTEKTEVVGSLMRSRTGHAVRVVIRLTNEFMATDNIRVLEIVRMQVDRARSKLPSGLEVGITGTAAIGGDMLTAAAQSVANTHRTTLVLVTIALLLIYQSPWLALVPLVTIGIAASTSLDLLSCLASWSQMHPLVWPSIRVFTTTKIFVIVLLFGAGTDFCLFLTARFREHQAAGLPQPEAIATALGSVGVAITASALTTIVGLAMMGWADFGKFTYSGPAIAICLGVTLVASLTLVPALLATRLGAAVGDAGKEGNSAHFPEVWKRLADVVLHRPGLILLGSLLLALPLAWIGSKVEVTYDLLGELRSDRVSRLGTQMLLRYFPPGEVGPMVVLAEHPLGDLASVNGQLRIAELAKPLDNLTGVDQVRSLYQPTGDPPGATRVFSTEGLKVLAAKGNPLTQAVFVSQAGRLEGKITRLFLIPTDAPFSPEAVQTCAEVERVLETLRTDPDSTWHGARFELLGPTAGIRDLERVTQADQRRIQLLVAGAVLLVIFALLRKPLVCCYLIATVVLSYLVTMGLTEIVFHTLRGEAYTGLDWKVPLFLFVILVAVGQDYNIYLVSRVIEEQRSVGPRLGLRRALVQTGGIITSCGIIMAGTFVSMMTAEMNGMVELGFALSLGILLDTFVVRTILVPAFLALLVKKHS